MRESIKMKRFKNDPFGIKYKIFRFKLKHALRASVKLKTKALSIYLNLVNDIGIPRDDEEGELLKKLVSRYDETIQELEENLRYARTYIKDGDN